MKICFFLGGFYQNGGIGRVTSVLANRLVEDPNIEIVTLEYVNTHKPTIYTLSPKIYREYLMESYQNMAKLMLKGGERKLRKFLQEKHVDVLVACGALFFPISVRACKGIETKCICWEHSNPEGNKDHRWQNLSRKFGIKRSDLNVVLTKSAAKVYKKKYGIQNLVQIYNPIDPEVLKQAKSYSAKSKRIISVGRLTYQKNFEAAVDVAESVLSKHPEWEWDIYGQGEEFDTLNALIREKGINRKMHFLGQVSNIYEKYSKYAFMVMTSRYEGFPMTLLEGIGNGLPLVSFDIPTGPDEIIEDGVNGFLIPAFDLQAMKQKVNIMMDDANLRNKLSQGSINKINMFAEEEIVQKWKDILIGISGK